MTDEAPTPAATAGALLRQARKAQGLHIAALATTLKIPPRKLEALEADRYDDLPDPAFTRALAKSACRALKIDSVPVLALLPRPNADMLDQVSNGLNTPFRERPGADDAAMSDVIRLPAFWIVLVLIIAALAVYFWPTSASVVETVVAPTAAPAIDVAPAPVDAEASAPLSALEPVESASAPATALVETLPAVTAPTAPSATLLAVRTSADSWLEVRDGTGRTVLSRLVRKGESLDLDGALPLRVTVGNATGTTLLFRGVAVDLVSGTRDNVARLELR